MENRFRGTGAVGLRDIRLVSARANFYVGAWAVLCCTRLEDLIGMK